MGRSSLTDQLGLPDPLMNYNWDFVIPNVPGGGNSRSLTIKSASCNLPGVSIDQVEVRLHGNTTLYAGMEQFRHNLDVLYLETRDVATRNDIRNWMEFARSKVGNTGVEKAAYATTVNLFLYDDTPAIIRTVTMYNAWPNLLDDVALDGTGQAQAIYVRVGFTYDYTEEG